jgi:predicted ATP-dependent serine protease
MSQIVLVMGESGAGKSHSLQYLDPKKTAIINVAGKPLPWRGWAKNYSAENGNFLSTDNYAQIIKALDKINSDRPEITTVVIDDFQYVMSMEYMKRATETGFQKFTEINMHAFSVVQKARSLREDLTVVFLSHVEESQDALGNKRVKAKTVGKMMDSVITLEGLFTVVLLSEAKLDYKTNSVRYYFRTRNDGKSTVKSPSEMFPDEEIENNLQLVLDGMNTYYYG